MKRHLIPALLFSAGLSAQSPLTTIWTGGTGLGFDSTIYFDLDLLASLSFTRFDVNSTGPAGAPGALEVRWCASTYVGNDVNAGAWTLAATGSFTSAGNNLPTACPIAPFTLQPGRYGFALTFRQVGQNFTFGTGGAAPGSGSNQTFSTNELSLLAGAASGGPVGMPICCQPRVFNGSIHYAVMGAGTTAFRREFGQRCAERYASFYEFFASPSAFDLANSSISMIPDGQGGYAVRAGSRPFSPPSPAATVLPLGDDSEATIALTGTFPHPSGLAGSLIVCSNGFVSMSTGNGTGYAPSAQAMLAAPVTAFWNWHDYNPAAPGSGHVVFEQPGAIAYVTFDGVHDYSAHPSAANTFQFQFDTATGEVDLVMLSMSTGGNERLVGYSAGGPSLDPGGLDLSARLPSGFAVSSPLVETRGLSLSATSRPLLGASILLRTAEIPRGTLLGVLLLGMRELAPPVDLSGLGMPGCYQHVSRDSALSFAVMGPSADVPLAIPSSIAFDGLHVFAQSAALSPGANAASVVASNGLDLTIGSR